jgi:uncharacterized protein
MPPIELIILFFIIATIYASAGFGGGSSYLAIMSLYGLQQNVMRPTSLICNIVVVVGGIYILWKGGFLNLKKIIPLSIVSIPLAFIGGSIPLKDSTFFILLGVSLVIAALLMFFQRYFTTTDSQVPSTKYQAQKGIALGGSIGFLSGMVGIGGGIFLSPILNLMKWDTPKHIAATASFFILVNSISGLAGQLSKNPHIDWQFVMPLISAVLIGGQLGSRLSAFAMGQSLVKQITALLVFYAGINILWTHI